MFGIHTSVGRGQQRRIKTMSTETVENGQIQPERLSDQKLAVMVAKRMGWEWGRASRFNVMGWFDRHNSMRRPIISFDPCSRPDHWWMVVEWVRGQTITKQLDFVHLLSDVPKARPFFWFILSAKPGRAICEAFVEVFCA
jgi:hypothetical protein